MKKSALAVGSASILVGSAVAVAGRVGATHGPAHFCALCVYGALQMKQYLAATLLAALSVTRAGTAYADATSYMNPPAIHTTCSAVNLENSPPGKIGGRGGFYVTFTMLPGYYPSNSGDYFYIWSFDATITRPSGPGSPGGNYPFSAKNKDPASLKLGHPVRLRLPSGGAAWGTEGMPMKDYRCSVTHLNVVLESPYGE